MTCGKIHAFYQSTDYNLDFFNLVVLGICYGYFCGVQTTNQYPNFIPNDYQN